jgi:hypothetical protein
VTAATDVHALGWLAHELVTLSPPRSPAATFGDLERAALSGFAPPPTPCGSAFDQVLSRACSREASERFADASALARALRYAT